LGNIFGWGITDHDHIGNVINVQTFGVMPAYYYLKCADLYYMTPNSRGLFTDNMDMSEPQFHNLSFDEQVNTVLNYHRYMEHNGIDKWLSMAKEFKTKFPLGIDRVKLIIR
jgi:hypothetical protein